MKILIVVDMQNDFITGSLGTKEAQAIVPNVVKKVQEHVKNGDLIIFTRDTHFENYRASREGHKLPVEHCIKNTRGWAINSKVAVSIVSSEAMNGNEYKYVYKPTFGSADLMAAIESYTNGEEFTITFMGFCSDICVISNVLMTKALFFDKADIYVDSKCCAGVTEDKHNAALEVMRSCQIHVI
jgi:nicotinamidase-related amidase